MCTKRLGGRFQDRIYRTDHAGKLDVTHSGFSSTHHLPRFRRRLQPVYIVLESVRDNGGFRTLERLPSGIPGVQLSGWDPLVPPPLLSHGPIGSPQMSRGSTSGLWTLALSSTSFVIQSRSW